jgi:hypothetical protein
MDLNGVNRPRLDIDVSLLADALDAVAFDPLGRSVIV